MGAFDTFRSFNEQLSAEGREALKLIIQQSQDELLLLRSEEARVRAVGKYILDVNSRLNAAEKGKPARSTGS